MRIKRACPSVAARLPASQIRRSTRPGVDLGQCIGLRTIANGSSAEPDTSHSWPSPSRGQWFPHTSEFTCRNSIRGAAAASPSPRGGSAAKAAGEGRASEGPSTRLLQRPGPSPRCARPSPRGGWTCGCVANRRQPRELRLVTCIETNRPVWVDRGRQQGRVTGAEPACCDGLPGLSTTRARHVAAGSVRSPSGLQRAAVVPCAPRDMVRP